MARELPNSTVVALDDVAEELRRRLATVDSTEQSELGPWLEQLLVDHPEKVALVLAPGGTIEGDLVLEEEAIAGDGRPVAAVVTWGNLSITGRLLNEDEDFGPFLIVGGHLKVGDVAKSAAPVIILGDIEAAGVILCDGDNGILHAGGAIRCNALIDNDHDVFAGRGISGRVASEEYGNLRELLVPDVFEDPDDPEDEWPDGALIRQRILGNQPLFKD
ncbi:MAG: hypothetical protein NW216_02300 [Hyphomicrobium sp.]|nr:hypothetical protein [Hyphomicrobium sp.]